MKKLILTLIMGTSIASYGQTMEKGYYLYLKKSDTVKKDSVKSLPKPVKKNK